MSDEDAVVLFCVMCFASEDGGSWGERAVPLGGGGSHCMNCGAGGSCFPLPRWAIGSVRKQASWVGKRYYPHDEDIETAAEVQELRAFPKSHPGRYARQLSPDNPTRWWVTQDLPGGRNISISVDAHDEREAMAKARLRLPYVPATGVEEPGDGR